MECQKDRNHDSKLYWSKDSTTYSNFIPHFGSSINKIIFCFLFLPYFYSHNSKICCHANAFYHSGAICTFYLMPFHYPKQGYKYQ